MRRRILIAEDNVDLADLLRAHLREKSFAVEWTENGCSARRLACDNRFDLIILDLALPGLDGIEVCRAIRQMNVQTPIVMLTSRATEDDRILGLNQGADDYVTKPFSVRELVARINAIFRRLPADRPAQVTVRDLIIDLECRQVRVRDRAVELTAREFDLLVLLAMNPGKAFSRRKLLDEVWGPSFEGYEHTVNTHINRLRGKIEAQPESPQLLQTVWGVGYRMAAGSAH